MACEEKGVQIIKLDPKMGDDKSRDWIAVTTPGSDSLEDEKRLTVRMPYPVGDRDTGCPHCNGTGTYENPDTHVGETCPYCNGLGCGVINVSTDGVVSLRYDIKSFINSEDGLGAKVDGETIVVDPTKGLTVVPSAIIPPVGYLSSGEVKLDDGVIVPATVKITGHNMSVETDGSIHANAETIKGFVAKLSIDITNSDFDKCNELVIYTVETVGTGEEWKVVYDTTKPYEHFEFSTIVSENIMTGVKFKVTPEAHTSGYQAKFTIDVHSF